MIHLILFVLSCLSVAAQSLPMVAVLTTGGTIASKHDPAKGGYVVAFTGEDLLANNPAIRKVAQIQVEQISNIGRNEMTPEIWIRLASRVNDLLSRPAMAEELKAMHKVQTVRGPRFETTGAHDDLVFALALALFGVRRRLLPVEGRRCGTGCARWIEQKVRWPRELGHRAGCWLRLTWDSPGISVSGETTPSASLQGLCRQW